MNLLTRLLNKHLYSTPEPSPTLRVALDGYHGRTPTTGRKVILWLVAGIVLYGVFRAELEPEVPGLLGHVASILGAYLGMMLLYLIAGFGAILADVFVRGRVPEAPELALKGHQLLGAMLFTALALAFIR